MKAKENNTTSNRHCMPFTPDNSEHKATIQLDYKKRPSSLTTPVACLQLTEA
jgi:hypothetical protein